MNVLGMFAVAIALVPAPREQVWRDGTCTVLEKDIRFTRDATLPPEGYRLDIAPDGVTVASADDAGAFYARKTLKQLVKGGGGRAECASLPAIPCGTVTDAPAFRWRGFMLDEGRHFFGKETVKDLLDLMADHKLNVFHWHLTEDQGWRLAIDRFPELVQYGAVRPESPVHGCRGGPGDYRGNGQQYGPFFYTASDVREILAYARERFITVVPEIEIPGHVRALLAAHPEFACRAGSDASRYNGTEYPASVFDIAWLGEGRTKPHAVGLLKPNAFGLYDMYGNVDEYCLDYYAEDSAYAVVGSKMVAPVGPARGAERVIRGTGSWWSASGDQARSAFRQSYTASGPWMCVGYRLVCLP